MKQYKVLWFDDEYETLDLLKEQATINGINHIGFTNAEQGIFDLEKNYRKYDAVIIDGLFYRKQGQSGDVKTDSALADVFQKLDHLNDRKIIPSFILSGQASFTKESNPFANHYKENKVYDKQSEKDLEELWTNIKAESDLLDDTQIRHQFNEVFNSCDALDISFDYQYYIITILKSIKYNNGMDEMLYFAQLRKIIELLFRKTEKAGLLHSSCIKNGEVNLSESSLFLSGQPTKYSNVKCIQSHFPTIIAENVKNIIFITGAAVHTEDEDVKKAKVSIEDLRKTNKTPFLLYSLVFQLIDIISWVRKYIDENADKEKNQALWETTNISIPEVEWIKGEVIRIADNGYGTFQPSTGGKTLSVIPAKVKELSLCTTQQIEVITKIDNTGKTLIENIRVV